MVLFNCNTTAMSLSYTTKKNESDMTAERVFTSWKEAYPNDSNTIRTTCPDTSGSGPKPSSSGLPSILTSLFPPIQPTPSIPTSSIPIPSLPIPLIPIPLIPIPVPAVSTITNPLEQIFG